MFIITYDFLEEKDVLISYGDLKTFEKGAKFRMYDDDGELYFEGCLSKKLDEKSEDGFIPLDEFGILSGCTEIRYLFRTVWETL